mmetsp:Transcript_54104/g.124565  ORF Transcript_54104/g.124565 Transcript_54104/m.124565 type:complete len:225 (+) Transcript_54104:230-904(+)
MLCHAKVHVNGISRAIHTARRKARCSNQHGLLRKLAILDRHVGDEVNETGGISPLVVVPGHKLHESRRQHDASSCIKDRGACLADEIRRDNLVLGVANDALCVRLRRKLHLGLDLVIGGWRLELASEVDHGDVNGGDTESHASELSLHDRVALRHGLGGAGRRWNDVCRSGTARAPIGALHRTVNGQLRRGGGVDGRHQTLLDAKLLVDRLDKRGQAIGGARGA